MTSDTPDSQPTSEGLRRYADCAEPGYYSDDGQRWACRCIESCPPSCKGQCGCKACHVSYQDFLSCE